MAAERRAIKKAARRHLKQELLEELDGGREQIRDAKAQLANLRFPFCDSAADVTVRPMRMMKLSSLVCALLAVAPVVVLAPIACPA